MKAIGYWTATIVLVFVMLTGGVADLFRVPSTAQGVLDLGYPPMFLTILGVWKILGSIALLVPKFPRLKEWAYAGAFFNFTGAAVSHLVAGSMAFHAIVTTALALVTIVSWLLRPEGRLLGTLPATAR